MNNPTSKTDRADGRKVIQEKEEPIDERALLNAEETLSLLDRSPVAVLLVDKDRRVWFLNDAAKRLSGISHEDAIGRRGGDILHCIHASDSPDGCGYGEACKSCVLRQAISDSYEDWETHTQEEAEFTLRDEEGEEEQTIYVLVSTTPVHISGQTQVAVWLEDVTALEKAREHYRKLSRLDPLTGLPNRRHFKSMVQRMLAESQRYGHDLCLMMLDLDGLKTINDSYGHSTGDDTLNILAEVLHDTKRDADFAARSGGDEYVVALPSTRAEDGKNLAERIRRACNDCRRPAEYPEWTVSIGIAEFQEDDDLDSLRRRADTALYQSKQRGKNAVTLWKEMETA